MRFSVVVNTYNRAHCLGATLQGLERQTHDDIEVIVVNGPSTDATGELLARWAGRVRVVDCPEAHLGLSRNLGIAAAAGDVVAFIDDDAVPEPTWLEGLAPAYEDPEVAGAGGLVFDQTGMTLQYRYSLCDRIGDPVFDQVPGPEHQRPCADPFVYLQGTNCSFRRAALEAIGGFDEETEYYLDEAEVCLRLIDSGFHLRPVDGAAVHHRYLASHLRQDRQVWLNPYPQVKNRFRFALSYGTDTRSRGEILRRLFTWTGGIIDSAWLFFEAGRLTDIQMRSLEAAVDRGIERGIELAGAPRRSVEVPPAQRSTFLPMPLIRPPARRLRLVFVSEGYPPGPQGGIGRFTADLAGAMTARGHEVHVVTRTDGPNRIDYEDGTWVHRIVGQDRHIPGLDRSPLRHNLLWCAAVHHEVLRLHERLPVDLVSAPIWNCEGLFCMLDPNLRTITNLQTTLKTVSEMLPSWQDRPHVQALTRLEEVVLQGSTDLHAISEAVMRTAVAQAPGLTARVHVVLLGLADRVRPALGEVEDRPDVVTALFVGRLERRKGVDLLLNAAPLLLERHPELELVLVGAETSNTELGESYRERFVRDHAEQPELLRRVRFVGEVDDAERDRWYTAADLFVAPSRYESFGLVLVEAMAFGLPVVSCAAGGIPEVVGDAGVLVPPDDGPALAEALEALVGDPDRRAILGKRARERYEERWTAAAWAERVEVAYGAVAIATSPDRPPLRDRLEEVLVEVASVPADRSAGVATALLDRSAYPRDRLSRLVDLLDLDDRAFVEGVYDLVLGRAADTQGLEHSLAALRSGASRLLVVAGTLESVEGRNRKEDQTWFARAPAFLSSLLPAALEVALAIEDDSAFVDAAYRRILLRNPDPGGKTDRLLDLGRGKDRRAVLRDLITSPEAEVVSVANNLVETWSLDDPILDPVPGPAPMGEPGRTLATLARRAAAGVIARAASAAGIPHVEDEVRGLQDAVSANRGQLADLERGVTAVDEAVRLLGPQLDAAVAAIADADATATANATAAAMAKDEVLARLNAGFGGVESWLDVLGRKQVAMAGEMRERLPPQPPPDRLPEPQIVDPAAVAKAASSEDGLRLNLGCGEKPLPGYVNVDARPLPDVVVVADIRRMPFEPETVAEIASHHLVEHFRQRELVASVLPAWRALLEPGGVLRVVCPNWEAMVRLGASGAISFDELKEVTFGAQDYGGDDHFAMYSPESLTATLVEAGFADVEVVVAERRNGTSIEMELVGRRP